MSKMSNELSKIILRSMFLATFAIALQVKDKQNVFVDLFYRSHRAPSIGPQNRAHVQENTIEQPLDHFNKDDKRTWQMVSSKYYPLPHFSVKLTHSYCYNLALSEQCRVFQGWWTNVRVCGRRMGNLPRCHQWRPLL